MDEPTTSLDLAHQHCILKLAREFAARGAGVLAVLRDLNLAAQYADRVVILHQAYILALGAPSLVLTPGLIQAAFGLKVTVLPHPELDCPLIIPAMEVA